MFPNAMMTNMPAITQMIGVSLGSRKYSRGERRADREQRPDDRALDDAEGPGGVVMFPAGVLVLDQRDPHPEVEPHLDERYRQHRHAD